MKLQETKKRFVNLHRGILWMWLASFMFSLMGAFIKASARLPTWEIVFFRALFNFFSFLPWMLVERRRKQKRTFWPTHWGPLISRSISGCLAMAMYFYAMKYLRLADASMLNNSSLLLVLLFSAFILKEKVSRVSIVFVAIAFIGVGFILKPLFQFSDTEQKWAAISGVMSCFFAAIAYISIKVATEKVHPNVIVFVFASVTTVISFVPAFLAFIEPNKIEWFYLLCVGFFATVAQWAMTRGYVILPASIASPQLLLTTVFSSMWGFIFWQELPDVVSILGMCLTSFGLVFAYKYR